MGVRAHVFIRGAVALSVTACLSVSSGIFHQVRHATAASTIYVEAVSDTNIEDLYRNTLIPDFQKAFPQYKINFTNVLHGIGAQGLIVDKLTAARHAGKTSFNLDVLDDSPLSYVYPTGTTYQDYFAALNVKNIPNAAKIDPGVFSIITGNEMAYRASAVVLAYNSQQVPNPPKTFSDLLAWIKANPGKFTYCAPDEGGSGGAFVQAALRSVMPADAFKHPYNKMYEANWSKAWTLLKGLEPDLFQNGFHPKGNVPVLNLLSKGSISMATAWSDQSLSELSNGLLPKYIKLTQISPAFDGGPATVSIPKLAQNPVGAKAFVNFILTPVEQGKIALAVAGFPAIQFKYLAPTVVKHFGAIATGYNLFPNGYGSDITAGWKANVPSAQ